MYICSLTELKLHKFENFESFLGVFVLCHHRQDLLDLIGAQVSRKSVTSKETKQTYIGNRAILWRITIMKKYNAQK